MCLRSIKYYRKAIDFKLARKQPRAPKEYKDIQTVVEARLRAVAGFPGEQSMSKEAAIMIMTR